MNSIKRSLGMLTAMSLMIENANSMPDIEFKGTQKAHKSPLSTKQKRARLRAKAARKARQRNR